MILFHHALHHYSSRKIFINRDKLSGEQHSLIWPHLALSVLIERSKKWVKGRPEYHKDSESFGCIESFISI